MTTGGPSALHFDRPERTAGQAIPPLPSMLAQFGTSGWWIPFSIAALVIAVNPIGYLGGGADDTQYLTAALCWAQHGACLPTSHWAARWPAVLPLAAVLRLLGESRTTAAIVPALWWFGAIAATGLIGKRLFGRRAGIVAASLLALLPIFADVALCIGADVPELTCQLLAVLSALIAVSRHSRNWAFAAGLAAAMAFETRETSAAFLVAAALICVLASRSHLRLFAWSLAGFAIVIASEMLLYGMTTGHIFYRYSLSLHHGDLFSSELDPRVDRTRSPILNPAFIAGWNREMGIHVFWPIDPWINLIVSPRIGTMLIGTIAGSLLWWKELSNAQRCSCRLLLVGAAVSSTVLVYVLAIDPKSRMFLGAATAVAMVLGALLSTAWSKGSRAPVLMLVGVLAALELMTHAKTPSRFQTERTARAWIASEPGRIEIDPAAADLLAMVGDARALPPRGTGKPLLLAMTESTCQALISAHSKARVLAGDQSSAASRGGICLLRY